MALFAKIQRRGTTPEARKRAGANAAEVTITLAALGLVILLLLRAC
jgi:hypothetical protein